MVQQFVRPLAGEPADPRLGDIVPDRPLGPVGMLELVVGEAVEADVLDVAGLTASIEEAGAVLADRLAAFERVRSAVHVGCALRAGVALRGSQVVQRVA